GGSRVDPAGGSEERHERETPSRFQGLPAVSVHRFLPGFPARAKAPGSSIRLFECKRTVNARFAPTGLFAASRVASRHRGARSVHRYASNARTKFGSASAAR